MKSLRVIRTHLSPYQRPDFIQLERRALEVIPGIVYGMLDQEGPQGEDLALITNTHTVLSELPPGVLSRTKLIVHPNSGYDNFTHDHALWEKIPTVIGHKIRAQAVAEYTLSCLFQGLQELPQHLSWSKGRNWERPLLRDIQVCVFGYGHIGKLVTSTLRSLGARVTVIDPFRPDCARTWREVELKEMRAVLACMGLNTSSSHLFNEEFFRAANDELLFINGARGGLVDERALKEFLLAHPKAFAFLDVFEKEPFTEEWHHFPQVWKTSHIAGVHRDLDSGIIDFEVEVLRDFTSLSPAQFQEKYAQELLQNKWIQGELI